MKKKRQIYFVGIGMGTRSSRTVEADQILRDCDCVIGAKRMLEAVRQPQYKKPEFASYMPSEICDWLEEHIQYQKVAIVLSGDTGFYSGAKKLEFVLNNTGNYEVQILPGISSVVYLASKLHTSWEDAKLVSAHGRKQNYIQTIATSKKTFLLLGGEHCANEVCKKIKEYGLGHVTIYIGRDLSYPKESILKCTGEELCAEQLEGLCTVMIENPNPHTWQSGSIPESEWIRGKVPMTKEEVRAVSIPKLRLGEDAVLYDIGAGTGSVAIEAALQAPSICVYAVEKNPEGVELIEQNKRKFGTDWVHTVTGIAPDVLKDLEVPTHVFIGGSSGNLKEILRCVREKNPKVQIVMNMISLETVKEVMEAVEEGLLKNPEIVQLSVAKAKTLGAYHMMMGQNPVYIVTDR